MGFGTYFWLGANLARLELRVMFEELLRALPGIRLAPGHEPEFGPATSPVGRERVRVKYRQMAADTPGDARVQKAISLSVSLAFQPKSSCRTAADL